MRRDNLAVLPAGLFDACSRDEVTGRLARLRCWPSVATRQRQRVETVSWILDWLASHPGRDGATGVAAGMNSDPTGSSAVAVLARRSSRAAAAADDDDDEQLSGLSDLVSCVTLD